MLHDLHDFLNMEMVLTQYDNSVNNENAFSVWEDAIFVMQLNVIKLKLKWNYYNIILFYFSKRREKEGLRISKNKSGQIFSKFYMRSKSK